MIDTSDKVLAAAASDVFSVSPHLPIAVLRPRDIDEVQAVWAAANSHGVALQHRGGGLSYTSGVAPATPGVAVLDMTELNRLGQPNALDRCITVEAGVTWAALDEALSDTGLRPALVPPISGAGSTIGGAVAQGLPTGLEAVIGVDVVLPDATLLAVGPRHFGQEHVGVQRMMGADILGLFLGTGGIFGTIVRVHLRLEPAPKAVAFRSFAVADMEGAAGLMTALSAAPGCFRLIAMPVRREADLSKISVGEKFKTGLKTLTSAIGPTDAVRRFAMLARRALSAPKGGDQTACVHVIIEAVGSSEAGEIASAIDEIAFADGASAVSAALPAVMQSRPYSLRGMLGPKGERWVPVHGICAPSQLKTYAALTLQFFQEHGRDLKENAVDTSWLMMAWPGKCAVIEPMFLWPAPLLPIHAKAGDVAKRVQGEWTEEASARTAYVAQLRADLTQRLDAVDALHVQLGQSYAYRSRLSEPLDALLAAIKTHVDPKGLSAPGNLGFGP